MYLGANVNTNYYQSTQVNISKESCSIELDISPKYYHALNAVHGSVYFKLLDDSAFFAAQSVIPIYFVLTSHFELDLLKPITNGRIKAVGSLISKEGRTRCQRSRNF